MLANHFIKMVCSDQGIPLKKFDNDALEALKKVDWTGNIRELRNIIERLVILCGPIISDDDVTMYSNSKN